MSILDRLAVQIPRHKKGSPLNPQYQLALKYMQEIEEARKLGYSWTQVCIAVKEEATARGKWNENWRAYTIEELYRKIKKEQTQQAQ